MGAILAYVAVVAAILAYVAKKFKDWKKNVYKDKKDKSNDIK